MNFSEYERPKPYVVETGESCDKVVVFLHGLGDTGKGSFYSFYSPRLWSIFVNVLEHLI